VIALGRACLVVLLSAVCGCASPRAGFETGCNVAGDFAVGALEGAGNGAVEGLRILVEARCNSRDCWVMLPIAAGFGAVVGGLAGALNGLQRARESPRG